MTNTYILTAGELPGLRSLLTFQAQLAAGEGTSAGDLCAKVDPLLAAYPSIQNTHFKEWYDQLLGQLHTTTTIGEETFPVLHMLWNYQNFCNRQVVVAWRYNPTGPDWTSFWDTFVNGKTVLVDGVGGLVLDPPPRIGDHTYPTLGPWAPPAVATWKQDDQSAMQSWKDSPPSTLVANASYPFKVTVCIALIDGGCHYYEENATDGRPLVSQQAAIINAWGGAATAASGLQTDLLSAEGTCFDTLITQQSLGGQDYFFLLHLLMGMTTGTSAPSVRARNLIGSPCNSAEYPNDTFANQLVYGVLLTLADPLGAWGLNNSQLQALLHDMQGPLLGNDPGSAAVRQSLVNHHKILAADSAYPLQDPYTNLPFPQRVTDTLASLDASRRCDP